MGSRQSMHGGPGLHDISYSVPRYDPECTYNPATDVKEANRKIDLIVHDEGKAQPKGASKWSAGRETSNKRISEQQLQGVEIKTNTKHTDWIGIFLFWLHKICVVVTLAVTLSSTSGQNVSQVKIDNTWPQLFVAQLIGTVGGFLLMMIFMFSAIDLTTVFFIGSQIGASALLIASVVLGVYGAGVVFLLMMVFSLCWYMNLSKSYLVHTRHVMFGTQQLLSMFPAFKWIVVLVSLVYITWMQVWNAAVYGCMHYAGAVWIIIIGFLSTTATATIFYSLVSCMVFASITSYFDFLRLLKTQVKQETLDSFVKEAPVSAVHALISAVRLKFGTVVVGSAFIFPAALNTFVVRTLVDFWVGLHSRCCADRQCCGTCAGLLRAVDRLTARFNKFGLYVLSSTRDMTWIDCSTKAWRMIKQSHILPSLKRDPTAVTMVQACFVVCSVAGLVCGLWVYDATDDAQHAFWFGGIGCFIVCLCQLAPYVAVYSAASTCWYMIYLEDPLIVARFYPSIYEVIVKGHVVFITMTDFISTEKFDEAVRNAQTYARVLEEVQTRTALAREGVMVECPFEAEFCGGGVRCVHCVDDPVDLAMQWKARDRGGDPNSKQRGSGYNVVGKPVQLALAMSDESKKKLHKKHSHAFAPTTPTAGESS